MPATHARTATASNNWSAARPTTSFGTQLNRRWFRPAGCTTTCACTGRKRLSSGRRTRPLHSPGPGRASALGGADRGVDFGLASGELGGVLALDAFGDVLVLAHQGVQVAIRGVQHAQVLIGQLDLRAPQPDVPGLVHGLGGGVPLLVLAPLVQVEQPLPPVVVLPGEPGGPGRGNIPGARRHRRGVLLVGAHGGLLSGTGRQRALLYYYRVGSCRATSRAGGNRTFSAERTVVLPHLPGVTA